MLTSTKFTLITIGFMFSTAHAAPCEENFSNSGNFLQGSTYKSFTDAPGISQGSAFDGAFADISSEPSWKILSSNRSSGDIQAVNADLYAKGKSVPFNVRIEALGNGSKVSVSYSTPAGMFSSDGPIKAQFCKTLAAASNATSGKTSSGLTSAPTTPTEQQKNRPQTISMEQTTNTARTSEYKKNGMPCIAELCLGDGIPELRKVKWDRAVYYGSTKERPSYVSDGLLNKNVLQGNLKLVRPLYRGELESVASYLWEKKFDDLFLTRAHTVVASCNRSAHLIGTFTSKSGNPTQVAIRLAPIGNTTEKQEWVVSQISRTFPQALSGQQANEIAIELQRRYAGFTGFSNAKYGDAGVDADGHRLMLMFKDGSDIDERLKLHPECGGSNKVNVD